MTSSLTLACLWAVLAAGCAMLPQRWHWSCACGLIVTGIPILGYATFQHGPFVGMMLLAAGVSVLRWPLLYLGRWLRDRVRRS